MTTTDVVGTLPSRPVASAVIVCGPSATAVVSHCVAYGAVVSAAPTFTPSTLNWTLATPVLSVAVAAIVTVPDTLPAVGLVMLTAGFGVPRRRHAGGQRLGRRQLVDELSTETPPAAPLVWVPVKTTAQG